MKARERKKERKEERKKGRKDKILEISEKKRLKYQTNK